jgi:hypothetical protein
MSDEKPNAGKTVRDLDEPQATQASLARFEQLDQHGAKGLRPHLVLGNYRILERIGSGGMGWVFRAEHRRMQRIVALKVLAPAGRLSADAVSRFQQEVRAVARLSHPHVVTAHDADEANGVHFLVTEFVPGMDLASHVKTRGPMPVELAGRCIAQAGMGLAYAHQKGVVHRDIKPANLLLDPEGNVKVLDLGLARIIDDAGAVQGAPAGLTQTGHILGTVDFMAPEQSLNTKYADQRSDIYSLGCTLYYLLAGKPMYDGETIMERLLAHRERPIPSLVSIRADVPQALDAVFRKMVAKQPADRYSSMEEVIAALQSCGVAGILLKDHRPTPSLASGQFSRPMVKRLATKWTITVAALLAALVGAAVLFVALNRGGHDQAGNLASTDGFQAGTEWEGEFEFDKFNRGTMRVAVTLRTGGRFHGTQLANPGNYGWHIEGSVQNRQVQWGYLAVLAGTTPNQVLVGQGEVSATLEGEVLTGRFFDRSDQSAATFVLRLKR